MESSRTIDVEDIVPVDVELHHKIQKSCRRRNEQQCSTTLEQSNQEHKHVNKHIHTKVSSKYVVLFIQINIMLHVHVALWGLHIVHRTCTCMVL